MCSWPSHFVETNDNHGDYCLADKVCIVLLTIGYMVSRGLAKSGSREPYFEDADNANSASAS